MNALQTNAANRTLNHNGTRQNFAPTIHQPHVRHQRPFGIGYGTSSGYATARRYVADHGPRMFRFS